MMPGQSRVPEWLQLIRAEYLEMPGLHLTKEQIQRLWGLDAATCEELLGSLMNARFLRRTPTGAYVLFDDGPVMASHRYARQVA
jgi:hypothetical protein